MSPDETAETQKKPVKAGMRRVSFNIAQGILAVHERKKLGHYVSYKQIAERFGINANGLKQAFSHWKHGRVDLGIASPDPEHHRMDLRVQHEKTRDLVNRHHALLLIHYEGALYTAEDKLGTTGKGAHKRMTAGSALDPKGELTFLARELSKIIALRNQVEEGYNSALDELRPKAEKLAGKPNPDHPAPIDVQTHVITASDEQRAIAALEDIPPLDLADHP